jgi:RHH-type proline utilization regulon transcriptional repressor/proline dehydrogenase/delta 1-pyrroline-5-carboxylate dehydrogenase
MIAMIADAVRELKIGDPREIDTHIGPVIDAESKERLDRYIAKAKQTMRVHFASNASNRGLFVAPHIFEIENAASLRDEVFGPVLQVARYRAGKLDELIGDIAKNGYGLTLGIHSRIGERAAEIAEKLGTGNVYVNRNMIGAVVGVQPFGGHGLSGTGPKAGGPNYLARFAVEQTISINTAAAGGDATLIAMGD